ncbi:MAG: phospholipid/cholesterol/gamma-HCH transport system substrate-binding protein [Pseudonocardiales bacterium]|jgi:phospholipid/cholesterol/gamma-HCH transport system substrate-binding protein|nr:phospholipid/cholesterol/gamma-HCH transport system substrate-binding protein [Pseudonocardiales bacterium]
MDNVESTAARLRYPAVGLVALVVFVLIVRLAAAVYSQDFVPSVPITIDTARAGLLMDPGAAVKMRGVVVGRVDKIEVNGDGVALKVNMDPDLIGQVPANVAVSIVPPTVFGPKYIDLTEPAGQLAASIGPGAVLGHGDVTVEANNAFAAVVSAIQAIHPARLNIMLNSMANALQGNGTKAGKFIRQLNAYTQSLNPSLPALREDIAQTPPVANQYAALTPDLVTTATNTGAISDTLVDQKAQLSASLLSLTRFGNRMSPFLDEIEHPLVTTLDVLRPTTRMLSEYSPELPCVFRGLVRNDQLWSRAMMGLGHGGRRNVGSLATVGRGLGPYKYPQDLPKIGANDGPNCYGLPEVGKIPPFVNFDTGATVYPSHKEGIAPGQVPLGVLLFGHQLPPGGNR